MGLAADQPGSLDGSHLMYLLGVELLARARIEGEPCQNNKITNEWKPSTQDWENGPKHHLDNGVCIIKTGDRGRVKGRNLNYSAGQCAQTQPADPLLRLFGRNIDVMSVF